MPRQFDNLTASELMCPRCRVSRPVRERLLLVLPHSELYDFRCKVCGESCGTREVKMNPLLAARAAQAKRPPPPAQRPAPRRPPHGYLGQGS
jgi:hypothetical protein